MYLDIEIFYFNVYLEVKIEHHQDSLIHVFNIPGCNTNVLYAIQICCSMRMHCLFCESSIHIYNIHFLHMFCVDKSFALNKSFALCNVYRYHIIRRKSIIKQNFKKRNVGYDVYHTHTFSRMYPIYICVF